ANSITPPHNSALRIQSFNFSARLRAVFCMIDVMIARAIGTKKHAIYFPPVTLNLYFVIPI
ncbi:MAG: hypothetical protein QXK18_07275, partial [Candidatus Bathyarchaeia archaeon]